MQLRPPALAPPCDPLLLPVPCALANYVWAGFAFCLRPELHEAVLISPGAPQAVSLQSPDFFLVWFVYILFMSLASRGLKSLMRE